MVYRVTFSTHLTRNFSRSLFRSEFRLQNLSLTQTEKLIAEFWISSTFILYLCNHLKTSPILSSTIKLKSKDEREISTRSFLRIKQETAGSRSTPFPTQVPALRGDKKDFTHRGIFFRCNGWSVFG